jgi:hypothetical protein
VWRPPEHTGPGRKWSRCALPVLIAGWVAQNKLVRGLSMGAVK